MINRNRQGNIRIIFLLLVLAGFVYGFYRFVHEPKNNNILSATTSSQALLTLQPTSLILPPNGSAQLMVSVGVERVNFVHAELTFDRSKVKLSQDISISGSPLTRVVKLTSSSEANSTGKITIALGLDPTNAASPPTGAFNIATLNWAANTTSTNITTSVNFTTSTLRVFNTNAELFTLSSHDLALTINPVAPLPPDSSPSIIDTTPPTVSITAPVNGGSIPRKGSVIVTASASDNAGGSGMAKVDFYINGSLKLVDTSAPYSYTWKVSGKPGASYTIVVRAYDKAGNSSSSSITVKSQ